MVARGIALVAAVVAAVVGITGVRHTRACDDARERVVAGGPGLAQAARDVAADCDAPRDLVTSAVYAADARDRASALLLARKATETAPGSYVGWLAVARLAPDGPEGRAALARARALNPRAVRR